MSSRLPGAIGYLTIADLDPSVRALSIDGAGPGVPRDALGWPPFLTVITAGEAEIKARGLETFSRR